MTKNKKSNCIFIGFSTIFVIFFILEIVAFIFYNNFISYSQKIYIKYNPYNLIEVWLMLNNLNRINKSDFIDDYLSTNDDMK